MFFPISPRERLRDDMKKKQTRKRAGTGQILRRKRPNLQLPTCGGAGTASNAGNKHSGARSAKETETSGGRERVVTGGGGNF